MLPGVIGLIQATESIKVLLGLGRSLAGRLLIYEALEAKFREFKVARDPECRACGPKADIDALLHEGLSGVAGCAIPAGSR